jgi:hypothetical protein
MFDAVRDADELRRHFRVQTFDPNLEASPNGLRRPRRKGVFKNTAAPQRDAGIMVFSPPFA